MPPDNAGRLAIHRRSDEIIFLQHRLRALQAERDLQTEVLARERDLADELLHTRHTEPLGETLQRRLVMAERICRDLSRTATPRQGYLPDAHRVAEIERQALDEMLRHWWVWLERP